MPLTKTVPRLKQVEILEGENDPNAFVDLPNPHPTDNEAINQKDAFLNLFWTKSCRVRKNYKKTTKQKILAGAISLDRHDLFGKTKVPKKAKKVYRKNQNNMGNKNRCAITAITGPLYVLGQYVYNNHANSGRKRFKTKAVALATFLSLCKSSNSKSKNGLF